MVSRSTYLYDAGGQLVTLMNPQLERTSYSYDAAGQRVVQALANGTWTSFLYDAAGRTTRVAILSGMDWLNLTVDQWGAMTAETWSILAVDQASTIEQLQYTYDGADRRIHRVDSQGDRTTWTYDFAGQLIGEHQSGPAAFHATYLYDPAGNRLQLWKDGDVTHYTVDAANRVLACSDLSGRTTYSYDAAGNQNVIENPTDEITTTTWDADSRQRSVELPDGAVVTFTYNCDHRRVGREDAFEATEFQWDKNNLLAELDEIGTVQVQYTNEPLEFGNLISQYRTADAEASYYHFDVQGSTIALTDPAVAITDQYSYTAFGSVVSATGTTPNNLQFLGQIGYYQDPSINRTHVRRREYDELLTRFLSEDPERYSHGESNPYLYAGNNPVNSVDPAGLAPSSTKIGSYVITANGHVFVTGTNNEYLGALEGDNVARDLHNGVIAVVPLKDISDYCDANFAEIKDWRASNWNEWFIGKSKLIRTNVLPTAKVPGANGLNNRIWAIRDARTIALHNARLEELQLKATKDVLANPNPTSQMMRLVAIPNGGGLEIRSVTPTMDSRLCQQMACANPDGFTASSSGNVLGNLTKIPLTTLELQELIEDRYEQLVKADEAKKASDEFWAELKVKFVVGLIPVVGEIADVVEFAVDLKEKRYVGAAISIGAAFVPLVGGAFIKRLLKIPLNTSRVAIKETGQECVESVLTVTTKEAGDALECGTRSVNVAPINGVGRNASQLLDFRGQGLVADDPARLGRLQSFLGERLGTTIKFDDTVSFGRIDEVTGTIFLNPKTATFDVLAHEISHVRFSRFMDKWATGTPLTNFEVNLMEAIGYHGTYRSALRSGMSQCEALNEALFGPAFAQQAIQAIRKPSPAVLHSLDKARKIYGDDYIRTVLQFEGLGTTKPIPLQLPQ